MTWRWLCRHPYRIREIDAKGVLQFTCESCGHQVPAIQRDGAERKRMKALRTRLQRPALPAKVTPIRRKA